MPLRIAIGGFLHESHSFAPKPTTYQDFKTPAGFMYLTSGQKLLDDLPGKSVPAAGALDVARKAGVTLVPLSWCFANPAGPVQDEAFERIAAMICAGLSGALEETPLDGVYLDLHGAGVVDSFPDLEGELLRRVRAIIGAVPLTISVDPHCNLTRAMVDHADAIAPFRTYPHVDMPAAGARAMALLLERIKRGKPWARAFRQVDFFIPITSQCTEKQPMQSVMGERGAIAAKTPGVVELGWCFGFPYADFADCSPAMVAYAETQAQADAAANAMHAHVTGRETDFRLDVVPAATAVGEAIRLSNSAKRPVVIADTQDNPGGGGHGDTTGMLRELIAQGAKGACVGLINDAESAAACHRAGVGATLTLNLGGKSDGAPLTVNAKVLKLTDGSYVCTGPMGKGNPVHQGPIALIEAAPGIQVIVASKKTQTYDQALFRHVGIEPADCKILVLKSSVHFRADFEPIAETVIVGIAPGPVTADPSVFPFKHLRPGVRINPRSG
jgi:microcystin degradation protein MlrC